MDPVLTCSWCGSWMGLEDWESRARFLAALAPRSEVRRPQEGPSASGARTRVAESTCQIYLLSTSEPHGAVLMEKHPASKTFCHGREHSRLVAGSRRNRQASQAASLVIPRFSTQALRSLGRNAGMFCKYLTQCLCTLCKSLMVSLLSVSPQP